MSTIAGNGTAGFADGRGLAASFYRPRGIVIDQRDGSIYVADLNNHKIRKINDQGTNLHAYTQTSTCTYSQNTQLSNPVNINTNLKF